MQLYIYKYNRKLDNFLHSSIIFLKKLKRIVIKKNSFIFNITFLV